MQLGKRVKAYREEHGLTQQEMAGLVGVYAETIHRWETGKRQPKGERLRNLLLVLSGSSQAETPAQDESEDRDAIKVRINELLDVLPESARAEALAAIARIAEDLERRESVAGHKRKGGKQGG